ncbi:MAG: hypothetical protein MI757_14760, partial [Pirellulales bacterium]|nr:hypothetical protein [Pirellulales bacterium]
EKIPKPQDLAMLQHFSRLKQSREISRFALATVSTEPWLAPKRLISLDCFRRLKCCSIAKSCGFGIFSTLDFTHDNLCNLSQGGEKIPRC